MIIKFAKVFSNDVSLSHKSIEALSNEAVEAVEAVEGTWIGNPVVITGTMTTGITNNNTVVGYEPTEFQPFEIEILKGDKFCWVPGTVSSFEHIRIER